MKKLILLTVCLGIFAQYAFAIMAANPTAVSPYKTLRISAEYCSDRRKITYKSGPDFKINSYRLFIKPAYTISYFPRIEAYGLVGMADVNVPAISYSSTFDGSNELAWGVGAKADLTGFDWGAVNFNFYSDLKFIGTRSFGNATRGSSVYEKTKYKWNEYSVNAYCVVSWDQWKQVYPYIGVEWNYLDGNYNTSTYRYYGGYFGDTKGYFNDPMQWPKPVIGVDVKLPKGFVLSFETDIWFSSDGTKFCVGLSQVSQKEEDD